MPGENSAATKTRGVSFACIQRRRQARGHVEPEPRGPPRAPSCAPLRRHCDESRPTHLGSRTWPRPVGGLLVAECHEKRDAGVLCVETTKAVMRFSRARGSRRDATRRDAMQTLPDALCAPFGRECRVRNRYVNDG